MFRVDHSLTLTHGVPLSRKEGEGAGWRESPGRKAGQWGNETSGPMALTLTLRVADMARRGSHQEQS